MYLFKWKILKQNKDRFFNFCDVSHSKFPLLEIHFTLKYIVQKARGYYGIIFRYCLSSHDPATR